MHLLELLSVYLSCDLVAIPSFYDGLPNACLEALALGVPVLCSRAGGLGDVVEDGVTGWTFAPGDLEDCRDALARAVEEPDRAALGASGAALIRERFTHDREAAAYEALLADAVRSSGASRGR